VASTTSTQDSGLLDVLIPAFERAYPRYEVEVIAVGTGEALELGRRKDADVLFVHAKADEERFVAEGYGAERRDVMYNDFVIGGPAADPAGVRGMADAAAALARIARAGATFVSRGDHSGTHRTEAALWQAAGVEPRGAWYVSTGQGMGEVLKVASEMGGYALTDRATFLALEDALASDVLVEGDERLVNQYGVIPVEGAANSDGARAFVEWITGDEGQAVIGAYGVERFGRPLFVPNARP
jgi:tungstate transport system substrate-binding protein